MTSVTVDGFVEFRFYRPQASKVSVVGEFNSWLEGLTPMKPDGDGWWTASTTLKPGEYRFRYVADGVWYTDYASHGIEQAPNGYNAVLVVSGKRRAAVLVDEEEMELSAQ